MDRVDKTKSFDICAIYVFWHSSIFMMKDTKQHESKVTENHLIISVIHHRVKADGIILVDHRAVNEPELGSLHVVEPDKRKQRLLHCHKCTGLKVTLKAYTPEHLLQCCWFSCTISNILYWITQSGGNNYTTNDCIACCEHTNQNGMASDDNASKITVLTTQKSRDILHIHGWRHFISKGKWMHQHTHRCAILFDSMTLPLINTNDAPFHIRAKLCVYQRHDK